MMTSKPYLLYHLVLGKFWDGRYFRAVRKSAKRVRSIPERCSRWANVVRVTPR